jgi:hypothetical protein
MGYTPSSLLRGGGGGFAGVLSYDWIWLRNLENPKRRDYLGDLIVNFSKWPNRKFVQVALKKCNVELWTGFNCLRMVSSCLSLWARRWTFRFHKLQKIFNVPGHIEYFSLELIGCSYIESMSPDSTVVITTDYWPAGVRFPAGSSDFSLHHRIQTGSETHPMRAGDSSLNTASQYAEI